MSSDDMKATRAKLLLTFDEFFYFLISAGESNWQTFEAKGGDVFHAMAKMLDYFVTEDIDYSKRPTLRPLYVVSLSPDGPWATLPIGPAYRQCSPDVQAVVFHTISKTYPHSAEPMLLEDGVEEFEAMLER